MSELVGLYLLINESEKNSIVLYRDNNLPCFQVISGLDLQKTKNKMRKMFKENVLKITVACSLAKTFSDVTFDSKSGTYYPYSKRNNETFYIHKNQTIYDP